MFGLLLSNLNVYIVALGYCSIGEFHHNWIAKYLGKLFERFPFRLWKVEVNDYDAHDSQTDKD